MPTSAPTITTLSSREFNQDRGRAKKAAAHGPVFITDRGEQTHVLLSIEDYRKLRGGPERVSITDLLYYPGADEIELELPERTPYKPREIDLS